MKDGYTKLIFFKVYNGDNFTKGYRIIRRFEIRILN